VGLQQIYENTFYHGRSLLVTAAWRLWQKG